MDPKNAEQFKYGTFSSHGDTPTLPPNEQQQICSGTDSTFQDDKTGGSELINKCYGDIVRKSNIFDAFLPVTKRPLPDGKYHGLWSYDPITNTWKLLTANKDTRTPPFDVFAK